MQGYGHSRVPGSPRLLVYGRVSDHREALRAGTNGRWRAENVFSKTASGMISVSLGLSHEPSRGRLVPSLSRLPRLPIPLARRPLLWSQLTNGFDRTSVSSDQVSEYVILNSGSPRQQLSKPLCFRSNCQLLPARHPRPVCRRFPLP